MDALLHDRIFHDAYPEWLVVALTFGLVTAGVAGGLTLALGLVVRTPGVAWRAVLVAVVVGLAYVLIGGIVDRLPGWTIGLPERINNHAMPRVTFLSDLIIGSVGAMLALLLLARAGSRTQPGGQQARLVAWLRRPTNWSHSP
jgi:hypothetical protein